MSDIITQIKPNDVVYWCHHSGKVYKGTVQAITLCEYQGALYCEIFSPSFRRNPYPTVHYSFVFPSRDEAIEFAEAQTGSHDLPMCWGCKFALKGKEEPTGEWILGLSGNWHCSKCGDEPYHSNLENMNFCPNCGVRMSKGDKNNG